MTVTDDFIARLRAMADETEAHWGTGHGNVNGIDPTTLRLLLDVVEKAATSAATAEPNYPQDLPFEELDALEAHLKERAK